MRPYVICHMLSSVDGKIDGTALKAVIGKGEYEATGAKLEGDVQAVNLLGEHFGIRKLLLEGGGHINGAFLQADLVDELSLLVAPGIDGRHDIPSVFDGVGPTKTAAASLKLKSVERLQSDTLWIRYEVVRS